MENITEVLAVSMPFVMVMVIVITVVAVPLWLKSREKREMQTTLRLAIEKGQALPPEIIEAMTAADKKKPATAQSDLRVGVIWFAVGLGVAAFGAVLGIVEADVTHPVLGLSAIPALIGLAFIVLSFFNPNKGGKAQA